MDGIRELNSDCRKFLLPSEDMCLHIITTGFSQHRRYLVVLEDAYQSKIGDSLLMSAQDIKDKYNISL